MRRLLTQQQVAEALGMSVRFVQDEMRAGRLPRVTLGGRSARIDATDLDAYIAARRAVGEIAGTAETQADAGSSERNAQTIEMREVS